LVAPAGKHPHSCRFPRPFYERFNLVAGKAGGLVTLGGGVSVERYRVYPKSDHSPNVYTAHSANLALTLAANPETFRHPA
jgi:hypothetical protein